MAKSTCSTSSGSSHSSVQSATSTNSNRSTRTSCTVDSALGFNRSVTDRRKRLAANARERKRMNLLNQAYDRLRKRLKDAENKSKYDVLVQAKEYITILASICDKMDKERDQPQMPLINDHHHHRDDKAKLAPTIGDIYHDEPASTPPTTIIAPHSVIPQQPSDNTPQYHRYPPPPPQHHTLIAGGFNQTMDYV